MDASIEGFYAVYLTGREGQGLAMIVLQAGRILGADAAGVLLNGSYSESSDKSLQVNISTKTPPNIPLIQGGKAGPEGSEMQMNFQLQRDFNSTSFVRVETPRGAVNARFVRLRGLNE